LGRRVKKAVYAYGSGAWELQKEILFVYDGWNLIHEKEVSATGDPLFDKFYVWGLDLSQTLQGAGGIGGLVCRVSGGEVRHYFYDANGNVGQLVNPADGAVTARYEYDPFGKAVFVDGADAEGNAFRFSTKYWDEETGLVYYGYRYYVPELGKWVNRDPIYEKGGINIYAFVSNNPINFWDIFGLVRDPKHALKSCDKGKSCKYNVGIFVSHMKEAFIRLNSDFTPKFKELALKAKPHPSPKYNTYTDSWNGHRIALKDRLRSAGKCIPIIKQQYESGKCSCCDDFFNKRFEWMIIDHERWENNLPPEIELEIQIEHYGTTPETQKIIGEGVKWGTATFIFLYIITGGPCGPLAGAGS